MCRRIGCGWISLQGNLSQLASIFGGCFSLVTLHNMVFSSLEDARQPDNVNAPRCERYPSFHCFLPMRNVIGDNWDQFYP